MKVCKKIAHIVIVPLIFLNVIALGLGEWIEKIEVGEIAAWKHTLENLIPDFILNNISYARLPLLLLTLVAIFFLLYKHRMVLICHASYSPEMASVDTEELEKEYYIINQKIDLCDCVCKSSLGKAVDIQDEIIKKVSAKHNYEIGYYGIAHTPLIFRAGFIIGDQRKVYLFHRARNNEALFKEWSNEKSGWDDTLKETTELNNGSKSQELYVAIGTTFPIKIEEISSINKNNGHVLIFQSSSLGFDVLGSYEQADILRNQILKTIRDREKKYNIRKLHLMISSSAAFTFLLGTSFSAQHDPEIIVYHYDKGKYTWGINMTKIGEESVIE